MPDEKESETPEEKTKAEMLKKAMLVTVVIFFSGLFLFVGIVIVFARLASKGH